MPEIVLPTTIWWTPGDPTEAIWELLKKAQTCNFGPHGLRFSVQKRGHDRKELLVLP